MQLYLGDCLDILPTLPDKSVDMVMCDLPYGTTACAWDSVIDMAALWAQYRRLLRPKGAVVLTAAQPFTTFLVNSNLPWFKYCWYWDKQAVTGFANAKRQPLRCIEDIPVFCEGQSTYNPQDLKLCGKKVKNSGSAGGKTIQGDNLKNGKGGLRTGGNEYTQEFTNYPRQVLSFPRDKSKVHPTQKPVALMEYLIRTYTNPGDVVLDNCAGSGSTGVAALQSGRQFIGIERELEYWLIAHARLSAIDSLVKSELP